jgi:hypothetical protein
MSSVMQAGPCVRSNQLDYDEDVMYKVSRSGSGATRIWLDFKQPQGCLTLR